MLNKSKEWKALQSHYKEMEHIHMRDLFKKDPQRFHNNSLKYHGLLLDYSKNIITNDTLDLLIDLATSSGVEEKRREMFTGKNINFTENIPALHTALRRPEHEKVIVDKENIIPDIHEDLKLIKKCSEEIRSGRRTGATGKPITSIINIGIGGSDLGPKTLYEALKQEEKDGVSVRFVSNIDGAALEHYLGFCDPETTLFIVVSKSFTTQETMQNAKSAKNWIVAKLGDKAVSDHFIAITKNKNASKTFGVSEKDIYQIHNWTGGRYSVWSSVSLCLSIGLGFDHFSELLKGAHLMDLHFRESPLRHNIPVLLALTGIWYRNFFNIQSQAIAPYSFNLRYLPEYLQQLEMESNGKNTARNGQTIEYSTCPVIVGMQGTNIQHSFIQQMHQGTEFIPCDFIGIVNPTSEHEDHHKVLLANMLAQSNSLMEGKENKQDLHKHFPGNKPSNTILLNRLDAYHLGMLLALYEHKTFVQGIIWQVNSFDQWGVELGKTVTNDILSATNLDTLDSSTHGLLDHIVNNTIPE
jgi:glucose-6-phosphate isomerase